MKFGSVCSGIEAASVAFKRLGWTAAWFSEIEPFPCALLAHHYPQVPNLGDMRAIAARIRSREIEAPDLLCGGTPCQAFSLAGMRQSLADERGNLTLEFVRIADAIDNIRRADGLPPAKVLWENVPGVLSTRDNAFGSFLGGLCGGDASIPAPADGWPSAGVVAGPSRVVAWRTLDAQYFGVAQRRKRVFVLAYGNPGGWAAADALLSIADSMSGHPAPSRKAGQVVTPTLRAGASSGSAGHGARSGDSKDELIVPVARALTTSNQRIDAETETFIIAGTLTASGKAAGSATQQDAESGLLIAHSLRGEGFDASEDGTSRGTPLIPVLPFDTTQMTSAANRSQPKPGDPCHPLAAGGHAPGIAYSTKLHNTASNNAGKIFEERTACLDANSPPPALLMSTQVRRLTPRECEALQGFETDYTLIPFGARKKVEEEILLYLRMTRPDLSMDEARQLAADGPRYKALGNSWAVPCAEWIGRRIQAVDGIANRQLEAA